jgi:chromosome segregation protein
VSATLKRLRIAGFKSFAEPVSLDILPGLTGIVGPNGCGKSNVVEALRWAMGETSARSLRGGEMDDVIFAGTTARASRNLAEVSITLEGPLPAPFEAEAELQVTRRIERGAGSQFRANGRELRARDVQTLYADLASGARSSGMVSQGRVAALVNAKPEERRQVLEEAAGITGLHARRHEAELKLRAAEQNLSRAEDLKTQLEGSREAMRKQARQAARYRNISGLIRAAEADHLAILLTAARAQAEAAEAAHAQAMQAATAASEEVGIAGDALAQAETALAEPRAALAEAARILERRRMEAEGLAAEAERVTRAAADAERLLLELEADLASAARARADCAASVDRLTAEAAALARRIEGAPADITAGEARAEAAAQLAGERGRAAEAAQEAALHAARAAAQAQAAQAQAASRVEDLQAQLAAALAAQAEAASARVPAEALDEAAAACRAAEQALGDARAALEQAEAARAAAAAAHAEASSLAQRARATRQAAEQAARDSAARLAHLTAAHDRAAGSLKDLLDSRIPPEALEAAQSAAAAAQQQLDMCEHHHEACAQDANAAQQAESAAARACADLRSAHENAARALRDAEARADRLHAEHKAASHALAEAERAGPDEASLECCRLDLTAAEQALAAATETLRQARAGRQEAATFLEAARRAADAAQTELARLAGEAEGLAGALGDPGEADRLLDRIEVPEGLEAALGAVLGEAAEAGTDPDTPHSWRALPHGERPALPQGSVALARLIAAPPELARVLEHCALVDDSADGADLQTKLAPGVIAVRRDGACWRWNGHVTRAGAPNAAAWRLAQRRRLAGARAAQARADAAAAERADALNHAHAADRAAARAEQDASDRLARAEQTLRAARQANDALAAAAAQAGAQRAALMPALGRLATELEAAMAARAEAAGARALLASPDAAAAAATEATARSRAAAAALDAARAARPVARAAMADAQAALQALARRAAEIEARIEAATPALADLNAQLNEAAARHAADATNLAALPGTEGLAEALACAGAEEARARAAESAARAARQHAEAALQHAREAAASLREQAFRADNEAAGRAAHAARIDADLRAAEQAALAARSQIPAPETLAALDAAARDTRTAFDDARLAMHGARAELDRLRAVLDQATLAAQVTADDLAAWQARHTDADQRAATLTQRVAAARTAWQQLAEAPSALQARAEKSGAILAQAEAAHAEADHRMTASDQRARALATALRDGEQHLAACRERAVRAQAAQEAAAGAVQAVLARANERLGEGWTLQEPEDVSDAAEERARKKFERLTREREEMGPVNLRAELELAELDERADKLELESQELTTAIAKLRGAIGHLNREGRERLTAVFNQVDQHFRTLFTRTMGGGRAHLALTGNEDPLLAGLEIYAEPPGKKLSALSLLSGGEQALTALSLIFAVFRCTPAPISVLDEVDAPLDDANVERFCTLLDDVVRDTGTRFLVVTHHQLTMSRMDRLFGVTMQERGVSRLLSVDLSRAVAMVEPVLAAAE